MNTREWLSPQAIREVLAEYTAKEYVKNKDGKLLNLLVSVAIQNEPEAARLCAEILSRQLPASLAAFVLLQSGVVLGIRMAEKHYETELNKPKEVIH
jgi:hypothetical protein